MSISFSSADGGLFASNPLRTDRISIKGVNWFGAEGMNAAPDGLWERSAAEYLDFAVEHGFNALRLPLAVNHVLSDPSVDRWFTREWAPADEHGARGVGEGATSSCRGRPTRRSWSTAPFSRRAAPRPSTDGRGGCLICTIVSSWASY